MPQIKHHLTSSWCNTYTICQGWCHLTVQYIHLVSLFDFNPVHYSGLLHMDWLDVYNVYVPLNHNHNMTQVALPFQHLTLCWLTHMYQHLTQLMYLTLHPTQNDLTIQSTHHGESWHHLEAMRYNNCDEIVCNGHDTSTSHYNFQLYFFSALIKFEAQINVYCRLRNQEHVLAAPKRGITLWSTKLP